MRYILFRGFRLLCELYRKCLLKANRPNSIKMCVLKDKKLRNTLFDPPRVSRIIWMAPNRITSRRDFTWIIFVEEFSRFPFPVSTTQRRQRTLLLLDLLFHWFNRFDFAETNVNKLKHFLSSPNFGNFYKKSSGIKCKKKISLVW